MYLALADLPTPEYILLFQSFCTGQMLSKCAGEILLIAHFFMGCYYLDIWTKQNIKILCPGQFQKLRLR